MGSLVACLTFIHGMRQQRISAFADRQVYLIDIALVCHTTKRDRDKEKKEGKPVNLGN